MDAQFCFELLKIMKDDYKNTLTTDEILKMGGIFQKRYQALMAEAKSKAKNIWDELPPATARRFPPHHLRGTDDDV